MSYHDAMNNYKIQGNGNDQGNDNCAITLGVYIDRANFCMTCGELECKVQEFTDVFPIAENILRTESNQMMPTCVGILQFSDAIRREVVVGVSECVSKDVPIEFWKFLPKRIMKFPVMYPGWESGGEIEPLFKTMGDAGRKVRIAQLNHAILMVFTISPGVSIKIPIMNKPKVLDEAPHTKYIVGVVFCLSVNMKYINKGTTHYQTTPIAKCYTLGEILIELRDAFYGPYPDVSMLVIEVTINEKMSKSYTLNFRLDCDRVIVSIKKRGYLAVEILLSDLTRAFAAAASWLHYYNQPSVGILRRDPFDFPMFNMFAKLVESVPVVEDMYEPIKDSPLRSFFNSKIYQKKILNTIAEFMYGTR